MSDRERPRLRILLGAFGDPGHAFPMIALARALVADPDLVLLDEPFAALDAITRLRMHDLVRGLREQHDSTMLLVTHDVDEAIALADRVLVLDQGRIAAQEVIETERPRPATSELQGLRRRLLSHLGVNQPQTGQQPAPSSVVHFPIGQAVNA